MVARNAWHSFADHALPSADLVRVVVAVDPAVTSGDRSDETGIVVAGRGADGHVYVLADYSGRYTPEGWAQRAADVYEKHEAIAIVVETHQGGDLVAGYPRFSLYSNGNRHYPSGWTDW